MELLIAIVLDAPKGPEWVSDQETLSKTEESRIKDGIHLLFSNRMILWKSGEGFRNTTKITIQ